MGSHSELRLWSLCLIRWADPAQCTILRVIWTKIVRKKDGKYCGSHSFIQDLKYLEAHTKFDAVTLQTKHAEFHRLCPGGKLRPRQFSHIFRVFFPNTNADDFCRHVFRTFDTDQNGIVDFREYVLALHVIMNGSDDERLDWAFRLYDIDNNGVIDPEEVTEIARCILDLVTGDPTTSELPVSDTRARARAGVRKLFRSKSSVGGFLTHNQFVASSRRKQTLDKMYRHSSCLVNLLTFPQHNCQSVQ